MNVSRTWTWLGWLVVLGCAPGTKSGGMIVDTEDPASEDGSTVASDPSMTSAPSDPTDESGGSETGDALCLEEAVCGDSVVAALEDCDTQPSCDDACVSTAPQTELVAGGGIWPAVIDADGSAAGITQSEKGELQLLRRWDAQGNMLWSVALDEGTQPRDIAFDDDGTIYLAGDQQHAVGQPATQPFIAAWEANGDPRFSESPHDEGFVTSITVANGSVVVAGQRGDGEDAHGVMYMYGADGLLLPSPNISSMLWIDDIAFTGDELVAVGPGAPPFGIEGHVLQRHTGDSSPQWTVSLPDDGQEGSRGFGVIADGEGGSWVFGQAIGTPYAARHDADGNEIEVLDCIGGATGWVSHAAIGPMGPLALAIQLDLHIDTSYELHAWFPVIADDRVAFANTFSSDTESAGPFAIGWRDDGARVLGWTNYGSEGGPGQSRLVLVP